MRLAGHETGLSPPVKYFYWLFQGGASFLDHLCYFFAFVVLSCASVYWCLVVTCWERAVLLVLICDVYLWKCHFHIGNLGQVWCLIVSIPDLCPLCLIVWSLWLWHYLVMFTYFLYITNVITKQSFLLDRLYLSVFILRRNVSQVGSLKAYILWYMESLVNLLIRDSFSISQT